MLNSALTALLISLVTWSALIREGGVTCGLTERGVVTSCEVWNLTMGVVWVLDEDGCCVGLVHTIGVL